MRAKQCRAVTERLETYCDQQDATFRNKAEVARNCKYRGRKLSINGIKNPINVNSDILGFLPMGLIKYLVLWVEKQYFHDVSHYCTRLNYEISFN